MNPVTNVNYSSIENSRILTKNKSGKLSTITETINSIKNSVPSKISGRCSATSLLKSASSIVNNCKLSCDAISNLHEQIIERYKGIDYTTTTELMKAFNQSLLLFDLGLISYEDLYNMYIKDYYIRNKDGEYVKADYNVLSDIYSFLPIMAQPLGGRRTGEEYIVMDPVTGDTTRVCGEFAFRLQGTINILSDLGIHVPIRGGINEDHSTGQSLHVVGLAMDFDTAHAININYNDGADTVTIRKYDKEKGRVTVVSESAYNVFYNTVDCDVETIFNYKNYNNDNRGLYAKIAPNIIIPEEYQKYVVTDLNNVIQTKADQVYFSNPKAENVTLVSIDGNFVDMNKLYKDAGLEMNAPLTSWPDEWSDYEAHHVELTIDNKGVPDLYDSTGQMLPKGESQQYYEILSALNDLK